MSFYLKLIDDEEDTLNSFMVFNITLRWSVFKVIARSQIVVPSTIPLS